MSGQNAKARQRGWWIPYTFGLGFAVVLVANGAMVYFATTTFSGLSTRHAYTEGLAYNARIAEEQAQTALGWSWTADLTSGSGSGFGERTLRLTGTDAGGHPLDGLALTAEIRRPAEPGLDRTVRLAPVGPGTYEARLDLPKPGQWDILVTAQRDEETYRLRRRLLVD